MSRSDNIGLHRGGPGQGACPARQAPGPSRHRRRRARRDPCGKGSARPPAGPRAHPRPARRHLGDRAVGHQRVLVLCRGPRRGLAGPDRAGGRTRRGACRAMGGLPHRRRGSGGAADRAGRSRLCPRQTRRGLRRPMAPPSASGTPAGGTRLDRRIDYRFNDPELLDQALAHRSWCAEQGGLTSNERLEFLGDAVLGLVVAEYAYRIRPELSDGLMSKVRASVVNTRVLAEVALDLEIAEHLRLGRGEDQSGGRSKGSILAAAVGEPGESDHKSRLQEESVRLGKGVPRYEVEGFGPDHARRYLATVYVAGQRLGTGEGRSKKDAEQVAAQAACGSLEVERGGGDA